MDTVLEVQNGSIDISMIFKKIDDAAAAGELTPQAAEGEHNG